MSFLKENTVVYIQTDDDALFHKGKILKVEELKFEPNELSSFKEYKYKLEVELKNKTYILFSKGKMITEHNNECFHGMVYRDDIIHNMYIYGDLKNALLECISTYHTLRQQAKVNSNDVELSFLMTRYPIYHYQLKHLRK